MTHGKSSVDLHDNSPGALPVQPLRSTRRRTRALLHIGRRWPGASERGTFDMNARRFLLLAVGLALALGLITIVLLWPTRKQAGGFSVNFVGLTNDGSGNRLAQFTVRNTFPRRVRFGVGEVQLYQTNGWPDAMRVAGGAEWLSVKAGAERAFSAPIPAIAGANWRVPLIYQEDLSFAENVRFRIDLIAWGISRSRPGRPAPVRHGDGFHRTSFTYSPQMFTVSNSTVQRTEASRYAQHTNRTPDAAGSSR